MGKVLDWLDSRTGYRTPLRKFRERTLPGGPKWQYTTASCLLWLVVVEVLTGFLLMASYSPSMTAAWASVHFIEQDTAGHFLRGVHYFAAQAIIIAFGFHIVRVLLSAAFRPPHELIWITGLFLIPLVLVWAATGNPLSGTQTGLAQIEVEGNIVGGTPWIGPLIRRILIGGNEVGHLTLTHLYFLHVALLPVLVGSLLMIHIGQVYRQGLYAANSPQQEAVPYWPRQSVRNMAVLTLVLLVISGLAYRVGAPLDMPADSDFDHSPRPEWYFLSLFELRRHFVGPWEPVATMLIPAVVLMFLIILPLLDRACSPRVSAALRMGIVLIGCSTWAGLTIAPILSDRKDTEHQAAVAQLRRLSQRARFLADHELIPPEGAIALLRNDPLTQGPRLFRLHCASCHSHQDAQGQGIVAQTPSAPNLYGVGTRSWIEGFLDPQRIATDAYFGNTAFAEGDMVSAVGEFFADADSAKQEEVRRQLQSVAVALSGEAGFATAAEAEEVQAGRKLLTGDFSCTDCHRFHDQGELGSAPDLTGYGSRSWLLGMIGNPTHPRFYPEERNDRMPVFFVSDGKPDENILTRRELELIVDWLRGDWQKP